MTCKSSNFRCECDTGYDGYDCENCKFNWLFLFYILPKLNWLVSYIIWTMLI